MPSLNAASQGVASCKGFAARMDSFFQGSKPDLVIISADWLEYARAPRFDGMIADLKQTVARLTASGIAVALLGPPAQFRSRLPAMLMRAQLRGAELRTEDFVLPDIFALDARMRAALPSREKFTYVSVASAICPARQCPLTIGEDIPLAWDHAHLTAEGSEYVVNRLAAALGFTK
jgi:lysophospholipase L1-like esterase